MKIFLCLQLITILSSLIHKSSQIVGGTDAKIDNYPFLGSIQMVKKNSKSAPTLLHHCGGALISTKHVLTAAHCFDDSLNPNDFYVLFGHTDVFVDWNQIAIIEDLYGAWKIIVHEGYAKELELFFNDIAIIVLIRPVKFKPNIELAKLTNIKNPRAKTKCNFAGWGSISSSVNSILLYNKLKQLKNEPVMRSDECTARLFFRSLDYQRTSNVYRVHELINELGDDNNDAFDRPRKFTFCIDLKKGCDRGTGKGDSGGPIMCKNRISGIMMGVGQHNRCDDKDNPQIFTNVWFYKEWIENKLK